MTTGPSHICMFMILREFSLSGLDEKKLTVVEKQCDCVTSIFKPGKSTSETHENIRQPMMMKIGYTTTIQKQISSRPSGTARTHRDWRKSYRWRAASRACWAVSSKTSRSFTGSSLLKVKRSTKTTTSVCWSDWEKTRASAEVGCAGLDNSVALLLCKIQEPQDPTITCPSWIQDSQDPAKSFLSEIHDP